MIGRVLLVPVWLILGMCYAAVGFAVNLCSAAKWFVEIILAIIFIGTLIWYRQQYMNYVILAIAEAMVFSVLVFGVFIEALLKAAIGCVSSMIVG